MYNLLIWYLFGSTRCQEFFESWDIPVLTGDKVPCSCGVFTVLLRYLRKTARNITHFYHQSQGGTGKAVYAWSCEEWRAWDKILENLACNLGSALWLVEQVPLPLRISNPQLSKGQLRTKWFLGPWSVIKAPKPLNQRVEINMNDWSSTCGQQSWFSKASEIGNGPSSFRQLSVFQPFLRPSLDKYETHTPSVNMNRNVKNTWDLNQIKAMVVLNMLFQTSQDLREFDKPSSLLLALWESLPLNFAGICSVKVAIKGQEGRSVDLD